MCYFYFNFWLFTVMWNENTSYHIKEQEMSQPSAISGLQMWMRAPKTAIQQMPPRPQWLLRNWGMQEARCTRKQDLAPGSWSAYEGNEFSEPRGLHLPIHRILNSLTSTWSLVFRLPTPFVANLYIAWFLPTSLKQFSQSYWDAVSLAQSPKHSHQIK